MNILIFFDKLKLFIINNFWKFVFFCFIGLCAFLIDIGFFNLFYRTSLNFIPSRVLAIFLSMIFNFTMNRNITFSARGYSFKKQIPKWLLLHITAMLINVGAGKLTLIIFGENLLMANIAVFIGVTLSIPITFFGSLFWAFKKQ